MRLPVLTLMLVAALLLPGSTALAQGGNPPLAPQTPIPGDPLATSENAGTITGKLVNGTTQQPVGGQTVKLRGFNSGQPGAERSAVTAPDGSFTFDNLPAGPAYTYLVSTEYGGIPYSSGFTQLGVSPPSGGGVPAPPGSANPPSGGAAAPASLSVDVPLTVYEPTTSPDSVRVTQLTFAFQALADERRWIGVVSGFTFENQGDHAYVGGFAQGSGVGLPLLADATDVQPVSGINPTRVKPVGATWKARVPLPPGQTSYAFSYRIPYENATTALRLPVEYPVGEVRILIPDPGVTIAGDNLQANGTVTLDGVEYRVYSTHGLSRGGEYTLTLNGLPSGFIWSVPDTQTLTRYGGLALALVLAGLALVYPAWKRRRLAIRTGARSARGGAGAGADKSATAANGSSAAVQLRLSELAWLDDAHAAGRIATEAYEERRAELKRELVALWPDSPAPGLDRVQSRAGTR